MTRSSADVVVVGAGIIGLSIAYQLARHRAGRVVVLEKQSAVAEGSTGASSAILRQRYSYDELVRLARDGLAAYSNWAEFTGLDRPRAEFERTGVLWMTGDSKDEIDAELVRLTAHGVAAEVLDGTELAERFPALSSCGSEFDPASEREHRCEAGGPSLLELDAGYTDPVGAAQDLLEASRRDGVEVEDPDDFERGVDPEFREAKIHALHHRLPGLPHRGRVGGLSGLYTVNQEDVHPIIGPTEVEGYLVANGFSGHGFKLAPMVGSMLAQWLTGEHSGLDTEVPLGFFAVDRTPLSVRQKSVLA